MQLVLVLHFKIVLPSSTAFYKWLWKYEVPIFLMAIKYALKKSRKIFPFFSFPGEEQIDENTSSNQ